jgi:phage shock protein C
MTDNGSPAGGAKVLRRSRSHRMLAGVCGGIAEYLSVDANLVRLVVAVLTVFGGSGLLLYVAGWLLIPEEGEDTSIAQQYVAKRT